MLIFSLTLLSFSSLFSTLPFHIIAHLFLLHVFFPLPSHLCSFLGQKSLGRYYTLILGNNILVIRNTIEFTLLNLEDHTFEKADWTKFFDFKLSDYLLTILKAEPRNDCLSHCVHANPHQHILMKLVTHNLMSTFLVLSC